MIVLDASIVVELLTRGTSVDSLRSDLASLEESFIAPHLLDIEVISAVRKLALLRRVDAHQSEQIISALAELPVDRYPYTFLLPRIWELRHNFTAYDAAYVALAEVCDAILYTADDKLTKGHRARVKLFQTSLPS